MKLSTIDFIIIKNQDKCNDKMKANASIEPEFGRILRSFVQS